MREIAMTTFAEKNHGGTEVPQPVLRPKIKRFLKGAAIVCIALAATTTAATIAPTAHAATGTDVFVPELSAIPAKGSRPSAPKTIFLNFEGGSLTKTSWNDLTGLNILPFKASGMTDAEKLEAYQETVQAFSSFDVNVVTTKPSNDDLVKTTPADTRYGVVVNISSNTRADPGFDKVYSGPSNTGRAPDNGFGSAYENQIFVSSTYARNQAVSLVNGQKAYDGDPGHAIGNTAVHEIGHTLGLLHHGFTPSTNGQTEYYRPEEGIWGPIMGSTGRVAFSRWSGGYPNDTHPGQDDIKVMTTERSIKDATKSVGFDSAGSPVRSYCTSSDGTTFAPELIGGECTAAAKANPANAVSVETYYSGKVAFVQTPESTNPAAPRELNTTTTSLSANGQLVTNDAPNYYSLHLGKGPASIDIAPIGPFSRLDVKVSLLRSGGEILAGPIDPAAQTVVQKMRSGSGTFVQQIPGEATGTGARIDLDVPADGSYVLKVEQASLGKMNANTAVKTVASPTYGSLGWYTVRGTITQAEPSSAAVPPSSPSAPSASAAVPPSSPSAPSASAAVPPSSPSAPSASAAVPPSSPSTPSASAAAGAPRPESTAPKGRQTGPVSAVVGTALAETGAGSAPYWFIAGVFALFIGGWVVAIASGRRPGRH
ncbi:hypothetical protein [Arthrobacter methylotrophus]|uniref:Peptidase metallopeptidase domain-containing protein n=1 Tax=Arthrobacter methylotrophus TaxID=121291 RepID=A0ABV5UVZ3_9MICC